MFVDRPISVLHVPYTFFPDEPGGTEVYVAGLIAAMRGRRFEGMVAAPGDREAAYDYQGTSVHRFKTTLHPTFDHAYGAPDEVAAESFGALARRLRPDIVHVHAHTAAVSEKIVDEARMAGAKVFFTYHTPSVSCLRGTMMLMGSIPCDGTMNVARCTTCTLKKHGVPVWLGNILARVPANLGTAMGNSGLAGNVATGLRMTKLVADVHARFRTLMQKVDCVIGVCQWVMDVLIANGVPPSKLVLCRQGFTASLSHPGAVTVADRGGSDAGPLRLSYFGRLDPAKGLDIVIEAIARIPNARLTLDIYGIVQPGSESYASRLRSAADPRVEFREALAPDAVLHEMADADFVVIPSRWLETGPLVVYEAFAAGTPVLGTRIGGVTELVTDDVDGVLVEGNDPAIWAQTILALTEDHARVNRLRRGIRPPRTMFDVADEMAGHYSRLLAVHA